MCGEGHVGGFVMRMPARFQIPWVESVDWQQEQRDRTEAHRSTSVREADLLGLCKNKCLHLRRALSPRGSKDDR